MSHPAVASSERRLSQAGARTGVFQDTGGEKQKICHGNSITPPLQTLAHTLHSAPINAKTPGHDLEPLNAFDGRWVLSDLTKLSVANDQLSPVFSFMSETKPTRE